MDLVAKIQIMGEYPPQIEMGVAKLFLQNAR